MAIEPTLVNFRALFPEFDSVAEASVYLYLDNNSLLLSSVSWGNCWGRAVLWLSAHEIALSQNRQASFTSANGLVITPAAQSGAVSSSSAGGLSAGFTTSLSQTSGNDNKTWLQSTVYGQRYAALKKQCLSQGRVVPA